MQILVANDDGIHAPGLAALKHAVEVLGDVQVVAPATEQSGVGHSITFLQPLVARKVYHGDDEFGTAVEGSPADSVKLGITQLINKPVDVVVSGINGGLNAGINVLYSGTVAAAIEGAFFGVDSFAISLEWDDHPNFEAAGSMAVSLIKQMLARQGVEGSHLYNINIPTAATTAWMRGECPSVALVPMGMERYGDHYEKREDPIGRTYYWATKQPSPKRTSEQTDLTALADGFVTVTPLRFNMTNGQLLQEMQDWELKLER